MTLPLLMHTWAPCPHPCPPLPAAPEQLLNGRVGLPSDVFSLGLLLHDLCTGEQPALVSSVEGRAALATSRRKQGKGLVQPGV